MAGGHAWGACGGGHAWWGICSRGDMCVCVGGGTCMAGGMHGGGRACVGGMHGVVGHVCWGRACMVREHAWLGGMHGRGMHGEGYAWQRVYMAGGHAWQERWPLQWVVHILLECILVKFEISVFSITSNNQKTGLNVVDLVNRF